MQSPRFVPITELEMMTPEERSALHAERTVTDLSQVDPAFLARVRARFDQTLEKRGALDSRA